MKETSFWKLTACGLGCLFLIGLVLKNFFHLDWLPQLASFLLGCLVSIGVAYSVVSPNASPVRLSAEDENALKKKQYIIGLVLSTVFAPFFLLTEFRSIPFSWFFVPIILLGPFLVVREAFIKFRLRKLKSHSR